MASGLKCVAHKCVETRMYILCVCVGRTCLVQKDNGVGISEMPGGMSFLKHPDSSHENQNL